MPHTYEQAVNAFSNNEIQHLANDPDGLKFLKLRSLSRKEYLIQLIRNCGLSVPKIQSKNFLKYLFELNLKDELIEKTIGEIYSNEREKRRARENQLVSELYKLKIFDWGGLHQNSLERTIVNNYVKKINSYDRLSKCIENELHYSLKSYVLCSWYNHWSSIIIEDIFRDHPAVLPAIGLIKKIDFFISDVPFDLKVTYFPEGFVKNKRKRKGLPAELSLLKNFCKEYKIHFESLSESRLLEDLWNKVEDHPSTEAKNLTAELKSTRLEFLNSAIENPQELATWFYENQGVRRFDAANRFFLVLVDCDNFFDSWRLKRAKSLLVDKVHSHLDIIKYKPGFEVKFTWDDRVYQTISDIVFVTHSRKLDS